jgi:asparagine N-glycosylation enzyme membrane subunit Stt3
MLSMPRFFCSLASLFMPPFKGLALLVVLYFAWAHMVYPHNDVMRGDLPDPDDYMYLAQVLDWLKGQGWYDNIQHRLDPPYGTPIHFSRFAQLPIATGVLLFESLGLTPRGAAMFAALIEPLILLGCCLSLLRRLAAFMIPARWAGASAFVALFSVGLLFEFMPGHVDHHGLVILLILAAVCCTMKVIDEPQDRKAAIATGLLLAVALMVALECLPWLLLIAAFLGVWGLFKGGEAARCGAAFGLALLGGSIVCLALTRPPATILQSDILTYSITYAVLQGR